MGLFDFLKKKKDPLSEFEAQAGKDQGPQPVSKEKKPGIFSKAAGAAGKAADWTLRREKELRQERDRKKVFKEDQEIKEENYWTARSVGQGETVARAMGIDKEDYFGQKLPPSLLKKIPGVTHKVVTEEFDVKSRAMELGIPLNKVMIRRIQENIGGKWVWVDKESTYPKSVAELRHEIMQYEHTTDMAKHEIKMQKRVRQAEPFIIGAQVASNVLHGTAEVVRASAQSPNLRPMGGRGRGVTPMGVQGGSRLFTPNFPRGGGGINPVPGAGMGGMRNLMFKGQQGNIPSMKKPKLW